jgi:hypothetical protein
VFTSFLLAQIGSSIYFRLGLLGVAVGAFVLCLIVKLMLDARAKSAQPTDAASMDEAPGTPDAPAEYAAPVVHRDEPAMAATSLVEHAVPVAQPAEPAIVARALVVEHAIPVVQPAAVAEVIPVARGSVVAEGMPVAQPTAVAEVVPVARGAVVAEVMPAARAAPDVVKVPVSRPIPASRPVLGSRPIPPPAAKVASVPPLRPVLAKYRISGVDRETKMDTVWFCEAASPENARVKADLEGIIVTTIELS